ncbi:MAG TPA: NADH-quinone oxidoreductase subunit C [Candidatus Acidoferrum sp.]|nr:NADH-quinone oxidoreductase subunit C [Candidatus Acidoferrum sp.]
MSQEQIETITVETLQDKVKAMKAQGRRLVQISATRLPDTIELTYSFDLDSQLANLRLALPADKPQLPSISSIYLCSVLYENEIHDLFGVQVDGLAIDFKGNFYKTAVKFPFASAPAGAPAKPAPTPAAAAPAAAGPAPTK